MKQCSRCGEHKSTTAYWRDTSKPDGLTSSCRSCQNTRRRENRATRQRRHAPRIDPRAGWCPNCQAGRHGRACVAALFGPDCPCHCAVLGYRGPFPFADPTAPSPADRGVA
jgi:hypothetical protein